MEKKVTIKKKKSKIFTGGNFSFPLNKVGGGGEGGKKERNGMAF